MAPPFIWWGGKEIQRGTPVVVKMENPNNWSMVELETPSENDDFLLTKGEKVKNKNAKQLTWVLLLKAHKAAGCLTSIASGLFSFGSLIRRRVATGKTDSSKGNSLFYSCIKVFVWLSLILLGFEIAAYYKGWHFRTSDLHIHHWYALANPLAVKGVFDLLYSLWILIRVEYIAPILQVLANVCIVLFFIQSLDRLILCLGCFWIRIWKIRPVLKHGQVDLEDGDGGYYPMVLVQIPMCNEKEVICSILQIRAIVVFCVCFELRVCRK